MYYELIKMNLSEKTEAERVVKNQQLVINKLIERTCDVYWKVEKKR
jgi:hypothetical protein